MKNRTILITGPSGVGKTTLVNLLLQSNPKVERLVTFTTRAPRPKEKDIIDFHFISQDTFDNMVKQNDFFEHDSHYEASYGNSKEELQGIWDKGKVALLVLNTDGVNTIKEIYPEAVSIFIKPDTLENLKARMLKRPMSEEAFNKRWGTVQAELEESNKYDHTIINNQGELETALKQLEDIIKLQN